MSPRVTATKAAIRAAVLDILEAEGTSGLSFQRVSEVSGVGRATVYRHYASVTNLLEDAFLATGTPTLSPDDQLPVLTQVRLVLGTLADELTSPAASAVVLAVLDQARQPSRFRDLRDAYVTSILEQLDAILTNAVATGEMLPGARTEDVFHLLFGPVMARYFLSGEIPDEEFLDTIADGVLRPWLRD